MRQAPRRGPAWVAVVTLLVGFLATPTAAEEPPEVEPAVVDGSFAPVDIAETEDGWILATVFEWDWDGDTADIANFRIVVSPIEVRWVPAHTTTHTFDLPIGETVEVTISAVDGTDNPVGGSFDFGAIEVPEFTTAPVDDDWGLVYDADAEAIVALYRGSTPDPATWDLDADDWIIDTGVAPPTSTVPVDGCLAEEDSLSYDLILLRDAAFGSGHQTMPSARATLEVAGLPDCPPVGDGDPIVPPAPPADQPSDPEDGDGTPTAPGAGAPLPTPPGQAVDDTPVGFLHRVYLGLFGRVADEGGIAYWMARADAGASLDQVLSAVLETPEARSLLGDLDDAGFVLFLYEQVLGRAPDLEGYEFWLTRLRDGSLDRTRLTNAFLGSPEMRQRVLAALEA